MSVSADAAGQKGIRDLANESGDNALLDVVDEVVLARAPVIRVRERTGVH